MNRRAFIKSVTGIVTSAVCVGWGVIRQRWPPGLFTKNRPKYFWYPDSKRDVMLKMCGPHMRVIGNNQYEVVK